MEGPKQIVQNKTLEAQNFFNTTVAKDVAFDNGNQIVTAFETICNSEHVKENGQLDYLRLELSNAIYNAFKKSNDNNNNLKTQLLNLITNVEGEAKRLQYDTNKINQLLYVVHDAICKLAIKKEFTASQYSELLKKVDFFEYKKNNKGEMEYVKYDDVIKHNRSEWLVQFCRQNPKYAKYDDKGNVINKEAEDNNAELLKCITDCVLDTNQTLGECEWLITRCNTNVFVDRQRHPNDLENNLYTKGQYQDTLKPFFTQHAINYAKKIHYFYDKQDKPNSTLIPRLDQWVEVTKDAEDLFLAENTIVTKKREALEGKIQNFENKVKDKTKKRLLPATIGKYSYREFTTVLKQSTKNIAQFVSERFFTQKQVDECKERCTRLDEQKVRNFFNDKNQTNITFKAAEQYEKEILNNKLLYYALLSAKSKINFVNNQKGGAFTKEEIYEYHKLGRDIADQIDKEDQTLWIKEIVNNVTSGEKYKGIKDQIENVLIEKDRSLILENAFLKPNLSVKHGTKSDNYKIGDIDPIRLHGAINGTICSKIYQQRGFEETSDCGFIESEIGLKPDQDSGSVEKIFCIKDIEHPEAVIIETQNGSSQKVGRHIFIPNSKPEILFDIKQLITQNNKVAETFADVCEGNEELKNLAKVMTYINDNNPVGDYKISKDSNGSYNINDVYKFLLQLSYQKAIQNNDGKNVVIESPINCNGLHQCFKAATQNELPIKKLEVSLYELSLGNYFENELNNKKCQIQEVVINFPSPTKEKNQYKEYNICIISLMKYLAFIGVKKVTIKGSEFNFNLSNGNYSDSINNNFISYLRNQNTDNTGSTIEYDLASYYTLYHTERDDLKNIARNNREKHYKEKLNLQDNAEEIIVNVFTEKKEIKEEDKKNSRGLTRLTDTLSGKLVEAGQEQNNVIQQQQAQNVQQAQAIQIALGKNVNLNNDQDQDENQRNKIKDELLITRDNIYHKINNVDKDNQFNPIDTVKNITLDQLQQNFWDKLFNSNEKINSNKNITNKIDSLTPIAAEMLLNYWDKKMISGGLNLNLLPFGFYVVKKPSGKRILHYNITREVQNKSLFRVGFDIIPENEYIEDPNFATYDPTKVKNYAEFTSFLQSAKIIVKKENKEEDVELFSDEDKNTILDQINNLFNEEEKNTLARPLLMTLYHSNVTGMKLFLQEMSSLKNSGISDENWSNFKKYILTPFAKEKSGFDYFLQMEPLALIRKINTFYNLANDDQKAIQNNIFKLFLQLTKNTLTNSESDEIQNDINPLLLWKPFEEFTECLKKLDINIDECFKDAKIKIAEKEDLRTICFRVTKILESLRNNFKTKNPNNWKTEWPTKANTIFKEILEGKYSLLENDAYRAICFDKLTELDVYLNLKYDKINVYQEDVNKANVADDEKHLSYNISLNALKALVGNSNDISKEKLETAKYSLLRYISQHIERDDTGAPKLQKDKQDKLLQVSLEDGKRFIDEINRLNGDKEKLQSIILKLFIILPPKAYKVGQVASIVDNIKDHVDDFIKIAEQLANIPGAEFNDLLNISKIFANKKDNEKAISNFINLAKTGDWKYYKKALHNILQANISEQALSFLAQINTLSETKSLTPDQKQKIAASASLAKDAKEVGSAINELAAFANHTTKKLLAYNGKMILQDFSTITNALCNRIIPDNITERVLLIENFNYKFEIYKEDKLNVEQNELKWVSLQKNYDKPEIKKIFSTISTANNVNDFLTSIEEIDWNNTEADKLFFNAKFIDVFVVQNAAAVDEPFFKESRLNFRNALLDFFQKAGTLNQVANDVINSRAKTGMLGLNFGLLGAKTKQNDIIDIFKLLYDKFQDDAIGIIKTLTNSLDVQDGFAKLMKNKESVELFKQSIEKFMQHSGNFFDVELLKHIVINNDNKDKLLKDIESKQNIISCPHLLTETKKKIISQSRFDFFKSTIDKITSLYDACKDSNKKNNLVTLDIKFIDNLFNRCIEMIDSCKDQSTKHPIATGLNNLLTQMIETINTIKKWGDPNSAIKEIEELILDTNLNINTIQQMNIVLKKILETPENNFNKALIIAKYAIQVEGGKKISEVYGSISKYSMLWSNLDNEMLENLLNHKSSFAGLQTFIKNLSPDNPELLNKKIVQYIHSCNVNKYDFRDEKYINRDAKFFEQCDDSNLFLANHCDLLIGDENETEKQKVINQIKDYFAIINAHALEFSKLTDVELKQRLQLADKDQNDDHEKLILLALLREAYYRKEGQFAYSTQLLPVIYSCITSKEHPRVLAEISTGQGKTLIGTLTSSLLALTGYAVHLTSANTVLSSRDFVERKEFYKYIGVTSNLIANQEITNIDNKQGVYQAGQIYYSTIADAYFYRSKLRLDGKLNDIKCAMIQDEMDTQIDCETLYRVAVGVDQGKVVDIYNKINEFIKENKSNQDAKTYCITFKQFLTDKGRTDILQQIESMNNNDSDRVDDYIANLLASGIYVAKLKEKTDYVIEQIQVEEKINGQSQIKNYQVVRILDKIEGVPLRGSQWSDAVHQLLSAKLNAEGRGNFKIDPVTTSLTAGTAKVLNVDMNKVIGITGTAGHEKDLKLLNELFGFTNGIKIPTHQILKRREFDPIFVNGHDEQINLLEKLCKGADIAESIDKLEQKKNRKKSQPMLIVCEDIKKAEQYFNELKQKLGDSYTDKMQIITGMESHTEFENKLKNAKEGGWITISGPSCGRGTDIKVKDDEFPGLYVVKTFFSNHRTEDQLTGRAGRQGKKGKVISIIDSTQYAQYLQETDKNLTNEKKREKIIERLYQHKIENTKKLVAESKLSEKLFREFCLSLNQIKIYNQADPKLNNQLINEFGYFMTNIFAYHKEQYKLGEAFDNDTFVSTVVDKIMEKWEIFKNEKIFSKLKLKIKKSEINGEEWKKQSTTLINSIKEEIRKKLNTENVKIDLLHRINVNDKRSKPTFEDRNEGTLGYRNDDQQIKENIKNTSYIVKNTSNEDDDSRVYEYSKYEIPFCNKEFKLNKPEQYLSTMASVVSSGYNNIVHSKELTDFSNKDTVSISKKLNHPFSNDRHLLIPKDKNVNEIINKLQEVFKDEKGVSITRESDFNDTEQNQLITIKCTDVNKKIDFNTILSNTDEALKNEIVSFYGNAQKADIKKDIKIMPNNEFTVLKRQNVQSNNDEFVLIFSPQALKGNEQSAIPDIQLSQEDINSIIATLPEGYDIKKMKIVIPFMDGRVATSQLEAISDEANNITGYKCVADFSKWEDFCKNTALSQIIKNEGFTNFHTQHLFLENELNGKLSTKITKQQEKFTQFKDDISRKINAGIKNFITLSFENKNQLLQTDKEAEKKEEDKKKAEAEKNKAEEDKKKAEAEKNKAEEDKKKEEAEKNKAEEDKKKEEAEKKEAEDKKKALIDKISIQESQQMLEKFNTSPNIDLNVQSSDTEVPQFNVLLEVSTEEEELKTQQIVRVVSSEASQNVVKQNETNTSHITNEQDKAKRITSLIAESVVKATIDDTTNNDGILKKHNINAQDVLDFVGAMQEVIATRYSQNHTFDAGDKEGFSAWKKQIEQCLTGGDTDKDTKMTKFAQISTRMQQLSEKKLNTIQGRYYTGEHKDKLMSRSWRTIAVLDLHSLQNINEYKQSSANTL